MADVKKIGWLLVSLAVLGAAGWLFAQRVAFGDYGWQALHPATFADDSCALYHAMRGLEQDPAADPANAALVARCRPQSQENIWLLSQTGDSLRFDRPSVVRLRLDPIDMAVEHHQDYPIVVVEFPYPPVAPDPAARWREWGGFQGTPDAAQRQQLARYWNPSFAELFAEWSLGRGTHEVWLGQAAILDGRHCAAVEPNPHKPGERLCLMHLHDYQGKPLDLRFPLEHKLEWRLEMLALCRFGGRERRWQNPVLQALFGAVEYSDQGCQPYVKKAGQ